MKKCFVAACLLSLNSWGAFAQSSVTIYGVADIGLAFTNNQNGGSKTELLSGGRQPSRLGFRGREDLGGGMSALFTLEMGLNMDTGTIGQGGRGFGRQSFVGLSGGWGTVTLGRQYDAIPELFWFEAAPQFAGFGTHVGDADNIYNTFRANNSVKYRSPKFGNTELTFVYGFGEAANDREPNSLISAGFSTVGSGWRVGGAVTRLKRPNDPSAPNGAVDSGYGFSSPFLRSPGGAGVETHDMYGLGGSYAFAESWKGSLLVSGARFQYFDGTDLKLGNIEGTVSKNITSALMVGIGYTFTSGKFSANDSRPKYHQLNLGANYSLSRRSELYGIVIHQRAAGSAQRAQIYTLAPSSGRSQNALVFGVRHTF